MSPVRLFRTPLSSPRRQSADTTPRRRGLQPPRHRPHPSRSGLSGHRRHRGCSRRRVVALLLAAGRGCGHHSRGDRVRRQADEEAPSDDGQRKAGGFGAAESLLGRAQKESRDVARRGRVRVRARPRVSARPRPSSSSSTPPSPRIPAARRSAASPPAASDARAPPPRFGRRPAACVGAGPRAAPPAGQTAGAFGAPGGRACCASAANAWSAPTRPSLRKPGACAGCICAGTPTSSSAFWCTPAASIWGFLMRQLTAVGTPPSLQGRVRALLAALILALSRFWRVVSRSQAFHHNLTRPRYREAVLPRAARA